MFAFISLAKLKYTEGAITNLDKKLSYSQLFHLEIEFGEICQNIKMNKICTNIPLPISFYYTFRTEVGQILCISFCSLGPLNNNRHQPNLSKFVILLK